MLYYEQQAKKKGYRVVVGIDEAGRGPLAGPVVVGAVRLGTHRFRAVIDDSKKLSLAQRLRAFEEIAKKGCYGVGVINEGAIDTIRIHRALRFASDVAVEKVLRRVACPKPNLKNTFLLFDGALSCHLAYPSKEIIGGDGRSLSIAAASIVAKVVRDRIMCMYDRIWPQYGFGRHKGYGTEEHRANIARYGLCPIHRVSFCSGLLHGTR